MPSVVGLFRLPEEEARFIDFLDRSAHVMALVDERVDDLAKLRARPLREVLAASEADRFLFTLWEHAPALHPNTHEGRHGIAVTISPVIFYSRGPRREHEITLTSLGAYASTLEDHTKWCRKVFAWVRRDAPVKVTKGWRATRAAADLIATGALRIAPY